MIAARLSIPSVMFVIAGCTTADPLEGQRTVFYNPHAVPAIERTGIGPQCDLALGDDATCLGAPLAPGGLADAIGNRHPSGLNRAQRRILRDRAELREALSKQADARAVPAPPQPVLPTAKSVATGPRDPEQR